MRQGMFSMRWANMRRSGLSTIDSWAQWSNYQKVFKGALWRSRSCNTEWAADIYHWNVLTVDVRLYEVWFIFHEYSMCNCVFTFYCSLEKVNFYVEWWKGISGSWTSLTFWYCTRHISDHIWSTMCGPLTYRKTSRSWKRSSEQLQR